MNLIIITPIRNEEKTLHQFIHSVLKQDLKPLLWIFINDNSEDESVSIITSYMSNHKFMHLLNNNKIKNTRETGAPIVDMINYGLEYTENEKKIDWNILLKLDGDLEIDTHSYFSGIMSEFEKNDKLGIASGYIYYRENGKKVYESKYLWNTQGATKFYRKECFYKIGGLKRMRAWDSIDDILARHHGFLTRKYKQYELQHFYKTNMRDETGGYWGGLRKNALGYRNKSYPILMYFLKSAKLSFSKPYLIGGIYFLIVGIIYNFKYKSQISEGEKKIVRKFIFSRLRGNIR